MGRKGSVTDANGRNAVYRYSERRSCSSRKINGVTLAPVCYRHRKRTPSVGYMYTGATGEPRVCSRDAPVVVSLTTVSSATGIPGVVDGSSYTTPGVMSVYSRGTEKGGQDNGKAAHCQDFFLGVVMAM